MNKEEFLKAIMELPKTETDNPISTMNSINVDDLMSAVDRLNKVPDYNDLLKENKILKENAENNDKVVDKANWENQLLKKENEQLKNDINKLQKELNEENLQCSKYSIGFNNLKEKNKQLKEQLLVAQTNEETFRLEMEDITKTLGLDEDTIFDDVKACVKNLKDNWNKLKEYCEEVTFYYTTGNGEFKTEMVGNARNGIDILNKMQELEQGNDSNE